MAVGTVDIWSKTGIFRGASTYLSPFHLLALNDSNPRSGDADFRSFDRLLRRLEMSSTSAHCLVGEGSSLSRRILTLESER